ncbi:MAG: alpha/beta hydrolase [Erythrobacter sp.]
MNRINIALVAAVSAAAIGASGAPGAARSISARAMDAAAPLFAGAPATNLQQRGERDEWRSRGRGSYGSGRVSGSIMYGGLQRQQIDIYAPDDALGEAGLIVYIHGGGWSAGSHKEVRAMPAHFIEQGYVFAAAGYRVLPEASVEQQAADLGEALRALRAQGQGSGFDPDRIVLMGHGSGAHLAALLASDPRYAGDAFAAIKGAVLVDGGGYDIGLALTMPEMEAPLLYRDVFGRDEAANAALSPISHVGGKDAPDWLILHVAERAATAAQAEAMAAALSKAGRRASVAAIEGTHALRINPEIGTPDGAAQTAVIDEFLARVLGPG